jgi:hypothetical protein
MSAAMITRNLFIEFFLSFLAGIQSYELARFLAYLIYCREDRAAVSTINAPTLAVSVCRYTSFPLGIL